MVDRLFALLPKLTALTFVWVLAVSTVTFAAAGREPVAPAPAPSAASKGPKFLVVPDVRRQAYVFAKGMLEDGGFAWRVRGDVEGYAANLVATQKPAPGTKVRDTGAPTIVLRLDRNAEYAERGLPENRAPYAGTELVPAQAPERKQAAAARKPSGGAPAADGESAAEARAGQNAPAAKKATAPKSSKSKRSQRREPAFHAPGAPREPLHELPLPDRARLLEKRLERQPNPSPALVRYWRYQHAWVVTGAEFGWSGGAEALRILIRVDRSVQARWGIGAESEAVARAALADVLRKSRR